MGIVRYFKMFPFSVRRDRFANEIQVEKGKEFQMNTSWLQGNRANISTVSTRAAQDRKFV